METRASPGDAAPLVHHASGRSPLPAELPEPPRLSRRRDPPQVDAARRRVGPPAPPPSPPPPASLPPVYVPTPAPAPAPRPAPARSDGHAHAHSHSHAHAHAHAHSHAPSRAHAHDHGHAHGHGNCDGSHGLLGAHQHDWSHLALGSSSRRLLQLALLVQGAFLLVEVVGGLLTNSLALLGDAAHMLADVGALGLALLAAQLAARPPDPRRTWGMPRAELLAATINSATLVVSCCWIAYEAVRRLFVPEQVHGPGLIGIAIAGLAANVLGAWLLGRADRDNVNIRAAMAHLLVDAASSVAVIFAGVVIALGGPVAIDTLASLLIAVVAVRGTWPVLRSALDSLLDAAPSGATALDVARTLGRAAGVTQVHDVHVWEPGPRRIAATAHVLVRPGTDIGGAILDLRAMLDRELGIDHATLQVAIDRRGESLTLEPTLPRDEAVERAVSLIAGARPSLEAERIRTAVQLRAAHVDAFARSSPVRLVRAALRDLDAARPA